MVAKAVQIQPWILSGAVVGAEMQSPLLDGSTHTYVNFDNAASTPVLKTVKQKIDEFMPFYSSVHRGSGFKSLISTRAYDQAHEIAAQFVGADPETECVIFGKNTTEAINVLANQMDFQPGDVVLCSLAEHHSNDLPWRAKAQVDHIAVTDQGEVDLEDLRTKLDCYAGKVRLVAITGASNVTGLLPPVHKIAEMAHHSGAMILVDCAQLAPHRSIQMGKPGTDQHLDFVAISAHKMYAPYGTGALVGAKEFFNRYEPNYRGGGTIEMVTVGDVFWADAPERDEAGSPNVVGAVALAESILQLQKVGMDVIAHHEKELTRYALEKLADVPGITLYGPTDPARVEDRLGVIPFNIKGLMHGKLAAILGFEFGIAVRNGCFCAHPYILRLLNISDEEYRSHRERVVNHDRSDLPGLVRVSFGCYNTLDEVDYLVDALKKIASGQYKGQYICHKPSGSYYPIGYNPNSLEEYFKL